MGHVKMSPIRAAVPNVVERSFNDHKQWRGIATRYDKLATIYRGGVVLCAITIWLREQGVTP
jgi:transposase